MDELDAFGNKVKKIRQNLGLSQEELAARCELDRTYISGVERGQRNLSLKNIYKLSRALKVSPVEFFMENENAL